MIDKHNMHLDDGAPEAAPSYPDGPPYGDDGLYALDALMLQRSAAATADPGLTLRVQAQVNHREQARQWLQKNRRAMFRPKQRVPYSPLLTSNTFSARIALALMSRSWGRAGAALLGALIGYQSIRLLLIPAATRLQWTAVQDWASSGTPDQSLALAALSSAVICALAGLMLTQVRALRRNYF